MNHHHGLHVFCLRLLTIMMLAPSCAGIGFPAAATEPAGGGSLTVEMVQDGSLCIPATLERMGSDDTKEDLSLQGAAALSQPLPAPGTWIFFGRTRQGTVKTITQQGGATELPRDHFGAELEIQPLTHPVDVRPSRDSMDGKAAFRFSVLARGQPVSAPVVYRASRMGRLPDQDDGTQLAVSDRETAMGMGRISIDAPGLWWITAEGKSGDGESLLASLSFRISETPGPDRYAAFTADGTYLEDPDAVARHLSDAQVIFLGEQHDDPVGHMLEKEILAAVHRQKGKVALSMEMFERDVQPLLDAYLEGRYRERHFLAASRPWPRYASDYRPMVEYAREHGLPVIAANTPRRMVNFVSRRGPEALEGLPELERRWLPPIPYYIPQEGRYVEKLREVFSGMAPTAERSKPPGPRTKRDWLAAGSPSKEAYDEMLEKKKGGPGGGHGGGMPPAGMMMHTRTQGGDPAQSLWDAGMAHSIALFLERNPDTVVVQINGSFHSDEHLGTVEQLLRYRPDTRVAVVSMVPDESFPAFNKAELAHLGDVIIITDPE